MILFFVYNAKTHLVVAVVALVSVRKSQRALQAFRIAAAGMRLHRK